MGWRRFVISGERQRAGGEEHLAGSHAGRHGELGNRCWLIFSAATQCPDSASLLSPDAARGERNVWLRPPEEGIQEEPPFKPDLIPSASVNHEQVPHPSAQTDGRPQSGKTTHHPPELIGMISGRAAGRSDGGCCPKSRRRGRGRRRSRRAERRAPSGTGVRPARS